jgi:beta-lactam-binding protein with PASTA domain
VAQEPEQGELAPVGSEVVLTVAEPWTVEVPDVVGQPVDRVARLLADAANPVIAAIGLPKGTIGLSIGVLARTASEEPPGTVVVQAPEAGGRAPLYGTVDLGVADPDRVEVPDLTRLDQAGAATRLTAAGLALGAVTFSPSARAVNQVLAQKPVAGATVARGATVAITLASAPTTGVPDLSGRTVAAAQEMLRSAGLVVGTISMRTTGAEPGTVVAQNPAAGAAAALGSAVRISVAAGVPNLIGRPLAAARTEIEALGLVVSVVEQPTDGPAGTVLAQDPAAGAPADAGTTVTVTVGVAANVPVPDLRGMTAAEARVAVADADLVLGSVVTEASDEPEGRVLRQTPAAGGRVARRSTVALVVAAARPVVVQVPDLVGQPSEEAKSILGQLDLALDVAGTEPSIAPAGSVVRQDPLAGVEVSPGTTVFVTLASAERTVEVPDLVSRTVTAAIELLKTVGLEVDGGRVADPARAVVTAQRPITGTRVPVGTIVFIEATSLLAVPGVVGQSEAAAIQLLARAGFETQTETQFSIGARVGTVVAQDPPAGTEAPAGATVTIVVARSRVVGPFEPFEPFDRPVIPPVEPDDRLDELLSPGGVSPSPFAGGRIDIPTQPTGPIRGPGG